MKSSPTTTTTTSNSTGNYLLLLLLTLSLLATGYGQGSSNEANRMLRSAAVREPAKEGAVKTIPDFIDSVLKHVTLQNLTTASMHHLGDTLGQGNAFEVLSKLQSVHAEAVSTAKHYLSASPSSPGQKRKTWLLALQEDLAATKQELHEEMQKKVQTASAAQSSHTCERLPASYTPYLFCSGVVDYAFYVPAGMSASDLDHQARTYGAYYTTYLNTRCLSDAKRMLCASFYLPCAEGGKPSH